MDEIEIKRENNVQVNDFLDYLKFEKGNADKTIESYKRDLKYFLENVEKKYDEILEKDIFEYIEKMKKNFKNNTVQRKVAAIKNFFKFLYINKKIKIDPTNAIKNVKKEMRLPEVLSLKEVRMIIDSYNNNPDEIRDRIILKLLIATGARISEIVDLDIKDVENNDYEFIKLHGKGDKYRFVPMYKELELEIKDYLENHRLKIKNSSKTFKMFPSSRRESFWKNLKEHAKRVGIEKNIYPHLFRHSVATILLKNGADIRMVQELLGHASITTTEIYTHVEKSTLKKIYSKINIGDD